MSIIKNTKEEAKQKISELIEKFENGYDSYRNNKYNETQTRIEFINPFFELLNWDINNSNSEHEVVHEDSLKVVEKHNGNKKRKHTKSPDYSFRIKGKRIFFVEAKKPSINIKEDIDPAYQVRRYGWSAKLGISILTDFEELSIYDTSKKPSANDKPSKCRNQYWHYKDYLNNFDTIWNMLERNNVLNGSLDEYIKNIDNKKGSEKVDDEFLKTLDKFRTLLASNISKLNTSMSGRDINLVVQNTIDRIIFLRIAEDRDIEEYGVLEDILKDNDNNYYSNLYTIFENADNRYNSGLFDLNKDSLSKTVIIDDKVIKSIIKDLYYPNSPYELSVIPVEILGSAYEQFLGKTITLDKNHKAKIEYKPEVRKAGGVYYTPEYIVKYIVENTVGVLIKNKTPKQIESIKILDPSCGSGSFLIGTYKYLLDYYYEYYQNNPPSSNSRKEIPIHEDGTLTVNTKKRILINNIFGVDIDMQAVEVTKLSLLLKCMEGESRQNLEYEMSLFGERALPSLEDNIKCGNSLIGTDFYTSQSEFDFADSETMFKVNAFDWQIEFKNIIASGGFDIVIGNPPYFNIQTLGHHSPIAEYIMTKYSNIWQDKSDILFYFLCHGINISKSKLGFIVSNSFLFADKAKKLRNFILDNSSISKIVNFEKFQVFKSASITTSIIIIDKEKNLETKALVLKDNQYDNISTILNDNSLYIDVNLYKDSVFTLHEKHLDLLIKKIGNNILLQDILYIGKGMETAANDVFLFEEFPEQFPKEFIRKRILGEMINRYYIAPMEKYLLYIEDIENFKDLPKEIQSHLKQNKKTLEARATVSYEGRSWYKYSRPMHKNYYHLNKIWCSYRGRDNAFVLDETSDFIGLTNTTVVFQTDENINLKYILALLNSKLLNFYHHSIAKQTGSGVFEYFPNVVSKLPIPNIDLNNSDDKEKHDKLVTLVNQIIALKATMATLSNPREKEIYERQASSIDAQIDGIVYLLYNLSEDEIKIIEG